MRVERVITKTENIEIIGATLLTIEEARAFLPLSLKEYYKDWWLQSPGGNQSYAATVTAYGGVDEGGDLVSYGNNAIRPALIIKNINTSIFSIGDTFIFGEKEFKIISEDRAFCKSDIGYYCFRKDSQVKNANIYEESDVKTYIDNWFEKAKEGGN